MAPALSYTTTAGKVSLGVNGLDSSTTCVDSAFLGSHADASFFWALLSLLASGPATTNTTIQRARTIHLVQRPQGRPAIPRALSTLSTTPPEDLRHLTPIATPIAPPTTISGNAGLVKPYSV